MIAWPQSLVEDIARRRCVFFLGAGVSRNSVGNGGVHPATWDGFLAAALSQCANPKTYIKRLVQATDYLTACELLEEKLGDQWVPLLLDTFSTPQYQPADLHKAIFDLDTRLVLTQNFDKIYDVYAQSETHGATVVKAYYDADTPRVLRGSQRAVIKVHGSIDEPSKMVFTREDYARIRQDHRSFQALMDALFLTQTFLFLGCSLSDPDLRLFLEQHAYAHPSSPAHYMTTPKGELHEGLDDSIRRNMNIRLLRYDPADSHKDLLDCIVRLGAEVAIKRDDIALRQDW